MRRIRQSKCHTPFCFILAISESHHTHSVWKNKKFSLTKKIFRQINSLVISLLKTLLSQIFCQKSVRENFRNFHTVVRVVGWFFRFPDFTWNQNYNVQKGFWRWMKIISWNHFTFKTAIEQKQKKSWNQCVARFLKRN